MGWIPGTSNCILVSMADEWCKGEYVISTDPARLDIAMIHKYLSASAYWAMGRPLEVVRRSIDNSLPFGVYKGRAQIGFARVVTDYATFAWLADAFMLPEFQGQGIGKWLIGLIVDHPRRHAAAAGQRDDAVLGERAHCEHGVFVGHSSAAEIRQHPFQRVAPPGTV